MGRPKKSKVNVSKQTVAPPSILSGDPVAEFHDRINRPTPALRYLYTNRAPGDVPAAPLPAVDDDVPMPNFNAPVGAVRMDLPLPRPMPQKVQEDEFSAARRQWIERGIIPRKE